jgi:Carbohydrate binding module (family 6)./Cellulase (glycosyl hydrolase family 5).
MKKCFTLLALMFAVSFASPVSEHGKLSVSGRKILDKNGNEYVLRGMSMYWNKPEWPGAKFYKQSTVTELAGSNWNANVVRAAIDGDNVNLQDAKNFMDWTNTAGIYVIVDWHVHNMDLNKAKSFFTSVASYAKEKSYTHVLYEVFNEPINQIWTSIKSDAEALIDVIRTNDKDGLIIVGTPYYSSDIGSARDNPITGSRAKNILYTFHFYSSDPNHGSYMPRVKNAWCADFPVFVSEFGTSKADGGKDNAAMDKSKTNDWMSLVESLGLSWANWSLSDVNESASALNASCCNGGTFNNNNLRESGTYIQNIMKKRNVGSTISSTGLTQQTIECSQGSGGGPQEKDGIIKFKFQNAAVNFLSISGMQDSVKMNDAPILRNSASTFSTNYFLTDVPAPGSYSIRFRYGTTASNATVSWQGEGLESGSVALPSTSTIDTWKDQKALINIQAGSSPLNFTFSSGGASNFAFVNFSVGFLSKDDSVKYGVTPIAMQQSSKQQLFFDVSGRNLFLHSGGDLEVYSLQGKRLVFLANKQNGETISLQNLPSGAYIAVLRKSGQVHAKTIYLK